MTLLSLPTNSTLGGELLSSVCKWAGLGKKRLKQTSLIHTNNDGKVTRMSIDVMNRVYMAKVEAVLYHHEPLMHLLDPMVIVGSTHWHSPMKSFLPQNDDTIYTIYVLLIDIATTSELVKNVGLLLGWWPRCLMGWWWTGSPRNGDYRLNLNLWLSIVFLTVFFQILYRVSKGAVLMFFKWSNLGSNVYVTDAEVVDDAYSFYNQIKSEFDTKIASISVNNVAGKVAESVSKSCKQLVIQHSLYVILLTELIFYPRTSWIQVLFALFWEKWKRCLTCAKWIELIIFVRNQLKQTISPTVLLS